MVRKMIEAVIVKIGRNDYNVTLTLTPAYDKKYELSITKKGELVFYGVGATPAELMKELDDEIALLIELSEQISRAAKMLESFENKEKEG